jgi:hypothetical protein
VPRATGEMITDRDLDAFENDATVATQW